MKKSTFYIVLAILDIILIIMWPIAMIYAPYPTWLAFIVGALWWSDWHDLFRHIENYKLCKEMEELNGK